MLSKLWFGLGRSTLEYGAEVWGGRRRWEEAEKLQRKIARYILKAKKNVNNSYIEGELNWMSLENRRITLRLRYWRKILRMKKERLTKKIYRKEIKENRKDSWTAKTKEILKDIGLYESWESQYTAETAEKWEKKIEETLENKEKEKWEKESEKSSRLKTYKKT